MTAVDPLAVDSRGWNPRDHGEMWWEAEPQIAFIAPPELTVATKSKILDYAVQFDHTNYIGDAEWVNLRVRRAHYRWIAPERAEEYEVEFCRCGDDVIRYECPAGDAICPRERVKYVSDFWQEDGEGCPWVRCEPDHPMSVTWIHVWDTAGSTGP
jgi:hypothetical protein